MKRTKLNILSNSDSFAAIGAAAGDSTKAAAVGENYKASFSGGDGGGDDDIWKILGLVDLGIGKNNMFLGGGSGEQEATKSEFERDNWANTKNQEHKKTQQQKHKENKTSYSIRMCAKVRKKVIWGVMDFLNEVKRRQQEREDQKDHLRNYEQSTTAFMSLCRTESESHIISSMLYKNNFKPALMAVPQFIKIFIPTWMFRGCSDASLSVHPTLCSLVEQILKRHQMDFAKQPEMENCLGKDSAADADVLHSQLPLTSSSLDLQQQPFSSASQSLDVFSSSSVIKMKCSSCSSTELILDDVLMSYICTSCGAVPSSQECRLESLGLSVNELGIVGTDGYENNSSFLNRSIMQKYNDGLPYRSLGYTAWERNRSRHMKIVSFCKRLGVTSENHVQEVENLFNRYFLGLRVPFEASCMEPVVASLCYLILRREGCCVTIASIANRAGMKKNVLKSFTYRVSINLGFRNLPSISSSSFASVSICKVLDQSTDGVAKNQIADMLNIVEIFNKINEEENEELVSADYDSFDQTATAKRSPNFDHRWEKIQKGRLRKRGRFGSTELLERDQAMHSRSQYVQLDDFLQLQQQSEENDDNITKNRRVVDNSITSCHRDDSNSSNTNNIRNDTAQKKRNVGIKSADEFLVVPSDAPAATNSNSGHTSNSGKHINDLLDELDDSLFNGDIENNTRQQCCSVPVTENNTAASPSIDDLFCTGQNDSNAHSSNSGNFENSRTSKEQLSLDLEPDPASSSSPTVGAASSSTSCRKKRVSSAVSFASSCRFFSIDKWKLSIPEDPNKNKRSSHNGDSDGGGDDNNTNGEKQNNKLLILAKQRRNKVSKIVALVDKHKFCNELIELSTLLLNVYLKSTAPSAVKDCCVDFSIENNREAYDDDDGKLGNIKRNLTTLTKTVLKPINQPIGNFISQTTTKDLRKKSDDIGVCIEPVVSVHEGAVGQVDALQMNLSASVPSKEVRMDNFDYLHNPYTHQQQRKKPIDRELERAGTVAAETVTSGSADDEQIIFNEFSKIPLLSSIKTVESNGVMEKRLKSIKVEDESAYMVDLMGVSLYFSSLYLKVPIPESKIAKSLELNIGHLSRLRFHFITKIASHLFRFGFLDERLMQVKYSNSRSSSTTIRQTSRHGSNLIVDLTRKNYDLLIMNE